MYFKDLKRELCEAFIYKNIPANVKHKKILNITRGKISQQNKQICQII